MPRAYLYKEHVIATVGPFISKYRLQIDTHIYDILVYDFSLQTFIK